MAESGAPISATIYFHEHNLGRPLPYPVGEVPGEVEVTITRAPVVHAHEGSEKVHNHTCFWWHGDDDERKGKVG